MPVTGLRETTWPAITLLICVSFRCVLMRLSYQSQHALQHVFCQNIRLAWFGAIAKGNAKEGNREYWHVINMIA
jgi:hypothetical protein